MTYSTDFHRKVPEVKERDGLSFEKTAALFGVGKSKLHQRKGRQVNLLVRQSRRVARGVGIVRIVRHLLSPSVELYG